MTESPALSTPLFISIEGIDGTGKSTLSLKLITMLNAAKNKKEYSKSNLPDMWKLVRAPDYSYPIGQKIARGLKEGFSNDFERANLYCQDRGETSKRIRRDIEEGCTAAYIADRWSLSEYVYGQQKGLSEESMFNLIKYVEIDGYKSIVPTLVICLCIEPNIALERMAKLKGKDNLDINEIDTQAQLVRQDIYKKCGTSQASGNLFNKIVFIDTMYMTEQQVLEAAFNLVTDHIYDMRINKLKEFLKPSYSPIGLNSVSQLSDWLNK